MLQGKNSILERLKANPQSISKILLQDSANSPQIEKLIKVHNIPVERVSARELARVKHGKDLQGIVAKVEEFEYTPTAVRGKIMDQVLQECRVIGESNPQMNPAMNALRHRLKKIP